jgi:hypothetical protein
MSRYRNRSAASSTLAALVPIVAMLALIAASNARAGTYTISNCPSAAIGNSDPGPWLIFGTPQTSKASCSGGPGDWIGPRGGSMTANTFDGVRVAAPKNSGITIREAKVWWNVPSSISGAPNYPVAYDNSGSISESATMMDGPAAPSLFVLASNATSFELTDYCSSGDGPNPCTFGGGENPNLELYGAQLTLADSGLPTGTVTGGGLAGTDSIAGTSALSYSAQDGDSGVRLVQLLLDGQPVATHDYLGECPYQDFAACPGTVSSIIDWNTTSASNGSHEVALRIVNAAHNQTIVDEHTITIDNASNPNAPAGTGTPIGPGSPAALRGPANGMNASDQAKLTARWAGTSSKHVRTSDYGATDRITGRLSTSAGQPISGASLDVSEVPAYQGAKTLPLARTSTGPAGIWALTLPRGISSSTLRFAYRSHQKDTVPASSATLTLRVHAGISLHIAPRTSSVGRSIFFSGALHGAPIPPGGKQLVLEASSGGEWVQFDTIGTDARGRYRARYRFKFPGPVKYEFRVISRYEADFPFLDGASNTVPVYER